CQVMWMNRSKYHFCNFFIFLSGNGHLYLGVWFTWSEVVLYVVFILFMSFLFEVFKALLQV
ncbi:MAG: hypothetical protein P8I60_06755, partial [Flavobacteriaceae bacterium]|nr:hypothetical protein [Flavobacteriaceae bacterium]